MLLRLLCTLLLGMVQPLHAMEIRGEYRNLLFETENSTAQRVVTDLNRLRLQWRGTHDAWSWQLSYDHELLYGGLLRDPWFRQQLELPAPTWLDAAATISSSPSHRWQHQLYRGWLRYEQGPWRLTMGRQRIAWGSGRIWNPTDRFNPVQPTALEQDQKLGVDAVDGQWRYSGFGGIEVVAAPGNAHSGTTRKLAIRWADTWAERDVAVLAGRMGRESVAGFDITGNLGDAAYRMEWLQSWGGAAGRYSQVSAGFDGTLANAWFPAGLYLAVEYFFNGAPQGYQLRATDALQSISHHLLGGMAGYDLTPLWRLDMLLLADLEQPGWFLTPRLRWSAREDLDLTWIAQWPTGSQGEFATFHRLLAMQLEWYF